jgi:hypothetical protein
MILAVLLLALGQNPNTSNIVIVAADGTMEVWPQLVAGVDNKPAIQAAIDRCEAQPGRETLRLPPGTWTAGTSVELVGDVDYVAEMVELKPLDATLQKAIVARRLFRSSVRRRNTTAGDRVSITGLTIRQTADTSASSHGLFCNTGDEWRLTRVKVHRLEA